jgi:hypothetical protein
MSVPGCGLPVVQVSSIPVLYTLKEKHRLKIVKGRVLGRIFGLKRDEVIGDWRKLHNEELYNLYSLPSLIRMIKSWRMRWARHVARMGSKRRAYIGFWWESQKERDH